MKVRVLFVLTAILMMIPSASQAGWVIHEDSMGGSKRVVYLQKNKIYNDAKDISSLIDLDRGWIHLMNKSNKSYWGGSFELFEKEMLAAIDKQIDEQMKDLPADQRKAMKERMRQGLMGLAGGKGKIEVVRTGKTARITGRDCDQYAVKVGGEVREEHWIAPSIRISREIDPEKLQKQMSKLKMGTGLGGFTLAEPVSALWKKGYPLKKVYYVIGQRMVTRAVKAEQKSIPAKIFQVPASFRKVPVMEVISKF